MKYRIQKGLDIPLPGEPEQGTVERKPVSSVALLGEDYVGLAPTVLVAGGERVRLGQPVVRDRSGYLLTAPGAGVVSRVQRGPRRSLATLVIELDDPAEEGTIERAPPAPGPGGAVEALLASGLWTALRQRPFGRVADPVGRPRSIFVTAVDTDPLAARPDVLLAGVAEDFERGTLALTQLADRVHVCKAPGAGIPVAKSAHVTVHEFAGLHPAGLPGTHMHLIDPVGRGRPAWHVAYPDVVAIGRLFRGRGLTVERVVALAGPRVVRPRLVRSRLGASIDDLTAGELAPGGCRVVSGSVLAGRQATSWGRHLGRYHRQVCVLEEPRRPRARESLLHALRRRLLRSPSPACTTALHGRPAAMVPTGAFERVVPLDVLPTQLLKALLVGDLETAEALGCLELDEEDLALCTYVCPSKLEYGAYLRAALDRLQESA